MHKFKRGLNGKTTTIFFFMFWVWNLGRKGTLSVRNFSFLVGKKKIIFLNNNCIKKLHNHLSELWDFVGVTLHLLVQNPVKEKWQIIRQIEQEQWYTCMQLCIWNKKWIPTTKSSFINRSTRTDGRRLSYCLCLLRFFFYFWPVCHI